MPNTIKIMTEPVIEFGDSTVLSGNMYVSNSPIGEVLESDTFDFTVWREQYDHQGFAPKGYDLMLSVDNKVFCTNKTYGAKLQDVPYGTAVEYRHDNNLVGKFYIKAVKQIQANQFKVECISAVGVLSYIEHYGGIYGVGTPTYVTDLIEDIVGDVEISIDSVFDTMMIQGYLPKASARDNLQQVLFAVGGAILKDANGNLVVKYNQPESATDVPDERIYIDGKVNTLTKATKVNLIEHSYFVGATTTAEDLFSNLDDISVADHREIVFSQPYYDLHAYNSSGTDITAQFIVENGVNYAIIGTASVGKGRITGKPYIHSQRQLTKSTGIQSIEANELSVTDATLISPYNSANCLERIASYYSQANEVELGLVYQNEKTGSLINFSDLYGGGETVGYIKSMDISLSNTLKAESKLATDWTPNHLGNTYNAYTIIDKAKLGGLSGNWIPQDDEGNSLIGKECYVVMFSGASGGQGGYNGANGTGAGESVRYSYSYNDVPYSGDAFYVYSVGSAGQGGAGGNGGQGGSACSRYNSAVLTLGNTYAINLGAGGNGGASNGGQGGTGGHTTFGALSSNEHDLTGVYVNIVDRSVYCQRGDNGKNGGNGGNGGTATVLTTIPAVFTPAQDGGSVMARRGGSASVGHGVQGHNFTEPQIVWSVNASGGGGGGASIDANGTNAGNSDTAISIGETHFPGYRWTIITHTMHGGNGGNGASATTIPSQNTLGNGGIGGNGAGGGGGGGADSALNSVPSGEGYSGSWAIHSVGGTGGTGSQGGKGSDGFIVVYYNAE